MINRIRLNTSKKGGGEVGLMSGGLKSDVFCLKVDGPINRGLIIGGTCKRQFMLSLRKIK